MLRLKAEQWSRWLVAVGMSSSCRSHSADICITSALGLSSSAQQMGPVTSSASSSPAAMTHPFIARICVSQHMDYWNDGGWHACVWRVTLKHHIRTSEPALVVLRADVLPQRRGVEHEDAGTDVAAQGSAFHRCCAGIHPSAATPQTDIRPGACSCAQATQLWQLAHAACRSHLIRVCSSSSSESSSYSLSDKSSRRLLGSTATQTAHADRSGTHAAAQQSPLGTGTACAPW